MSWKTLFAGASLLALSLGGVQAAQAPKPEEVVSAYADIAAAMYADSATAARKLTQAVDAFLANPNTATLLAAREAWKAARVPYPQTEAFRFGNAHVDEWEGKVNAWPLDEGLIDYVDVSVYGETSDENPLHGLNVIATPKLQIGADEVDASVIDTKLLSGVLHEAQGVESNVATGYHAIEFLLWGQDLNGTGPGTGNRPASDFDTKNCTGGHCDRRRAYLKAATDLLVSDLDDMAAAWASDGAARAALKAKTPKEGLAVILTGLGSLSYGELAGERIKLGLMLHDPEEEQDCFSDNTHNSHYYAQTGMMAIWRGSYTRLDGSKLQTVSLHDLAAAQAPEAAQALNAAMDDTLKRMTVMKTTADSGAMAYDQMLAEGNEKGNAILNDVVDGLVAQTRAMEQVAKALDLEITVEGSDSLDAPSPESSGK